MKINTMLNSKETTETIQGEVHFVAADTIDTYIRFSGSMEIMGGD